MWTHTPATPSPSRSNSTSADSGYLSQYNTDGNAHTPLMTGLPSLDMDASLPNIAHEASPCEATGREDTTTIQQATCRWWLSRAPPTL
jgi:hypothetical protein